MGHPSPVVLPYARWWRTGSLSLFLLAVPLIALALAMGSVEGSITGDQPPASGDWVVRNPTTVSNETITLYGDIVVEANLTIADSILRLMPTSDGALTINVTSGGRLVVTDTLITSGNDHAFGFLVTGEMVLDRVTVKRPYLGIRVITNDDVLIANTTVLDPVDTAILLEGADGTVLRNVHVRANGFDPIVSANVDIPNGAPVTLDDLSPPGLVRIVGGAPTIDGLDLSVNGSVQMDILMVKKGNYAELEIPCLWSMLEVDTREALVLRDLTLRDSNIGMDVDLRIRNEVAGGNTLFVSHFKVALVTLSNYRDVRIEGMVSREVNGLGTLTNTTTSGLPLGGSIGLGLDDGIWLVVATVDETFSSKGPHRFDLSISDVVATGTRVLDYDFVPDHTGAQRPTFDTSLLVDNASVRYGADVINISTAPRFQSFDRFHSDLTITNSSFHRLDGRAITVGNVIWPSEHLVIEGCNLSKNRQSGEGLIVLSIPRSVSNNLPNLVNIEDNVFSDNIGTLMMVTGSGYGTSRLEELTIEDNAFINNTCWFWEGMALMEVSGVGRVVMENNTFEDNFSPMGIHLTHDGGYVSPSGIDVKDPCEFRITNNTFDNNWILAPGEFVEGLFEVTWGGDLVVSGNDIGRGRGYFLNASERTDLSRKATLDFTNNDIHDNSGAILFFSTTDENHSRLEVTIQANRAWDNAGPLTSYPRSSDLGGQLLLDHEARFVFVNNTVLRSTAPVFIAYGNLTARGNTFKGCTNYSLLFENLRDSQPYIAGNVFTGCGDVISISAKESVIIPVLLWMDGNQIDCTGVALHTRRMELTMRNTNITSSANTTIIAELSYIDAINCQLEASQAVVEIDGYIRVWFWVEARVEWADISGTASGNPVPDANVSFFDRTGEWAATEIADGEGHLGPVTVMSWHIEHTFDPVVLSPYTVVTSLSSFHTNSTLDLNRSFVGEDALLLLLVDPVVPYATIDAPLNGEMFNVTALEVLTYSEDTGSGILHVNISILDHTSIELPYNDTDRYDHLFIGVPEGQLVLRVTFTDAALNTLVLVRVVEVDATPPKLVIIEPADGTLTNATHVMLRGGTEPDAVLTVNMQVVPHPSGEFLYQLDLMEGLNRFEVLAEDAFGNTAFFLLEVTRDSIPPDLDLSHPRDGLELNRTEVMVVGLASDHDAVHISVLRQHTDVIGLVVPTDHLGHFALSVELEEGRNVIVVTATDLAGNEMVVRRTVIVDVTPPEVAILSPEYGTLTNRDVITVVIQVGEDAEQVYVNGKRVLSTGTVNVSVPLAEGENHIEVRVLDHLDNEARTSTTVYMDSLPPGLNITEPSTDEIWTNDPVLEVAGRVDQGGVRVTVMDQVAKLSNDEFSITITLPGDGTHRVVVRAEDQAGNTVQTSFLVHLSTVSPLLLVSYDPTTLEFIDEGYVRVYGTTTEDVRSVTIVHETGDGPETMTVPLLGDAFTYTVTLAEGDNLIRVSVVDRYNNTNSTTSPTIVLKVPGDPVTEGGDSFSTTLAIVLLVVIAVLAAVIVMMRARTPEDGPEVSEDGPVEPDGPPRDGGE